MWDYVGEFRIFIRGFFEMVRMDPDTNHTVSFLLERFLEMFGGVVGGSA